MLNKTILMGRLTAEPELRRTQNNTSVTSFTLAVNRSYARQGEQAQTDFIDVVAWRATAEFVAKYFTKGRMAVVEGRLQIRPWTDKEGNKRTSAEVVAENVYFGDSKRDGGDSGYAPSYGGGYGAPAGGGYGAPAGGNGGYRAPSAPRSDFAEIGEEDGELPF